MVDFAQKSMINKKAYETLAEIKAVSADSFDQLIVVGKIDDLDVAKVIINKLLSEIQGVEK